MFNYSSELEQKRKLDNAYQAWTQLLKHRSPIDLSNLQHLSILSHRHSLLDSALEHTLASTVWLEHQGSRVLARLLQACLRSDINRKEGAKQIASLLPHNFHTDPTFLYVIEKMGWRHGYMAWDLGWKPSQDAMLSMAGLWNRQWLSDYARYKTKDEWISALQDWKQTLACISPKNTADWCALITSNNINMGSGGTFLNEHGKPMRGQDINAWFNQKTPSIAKETSAYTQHWVAFLQQHERSDMLWLSLATRNWFNPDSLPITRIPYNEIPTAGSTSGLTRAFDCLKYIQAYDKQHWRIRDSEYLHKYLANVGFVSTQPTAEYTKLAHMLALTEGTVRHPLELHTLINQIDNHGESMVPKDIRFLESIDMYT